MMYTRFGTLIVAVKDYEPDTGEISVKREGRSQFDLRCHISELKADGGLAEILEALQSRGPKSGDTIRVGDRVEGGDIPDDRDTGTVLSLDGDMAIVAWDSHIQTPAPVSDLRRI